MCRGDGGSDVAVWICPVRVEPFPGVLATESADGGGGVGAHARVGVVEEWADVFGVGRVAQAGERGDCPGSADRVLVGQSAGHVVAAVPLWFMAEQPQVGAPDPYVVTV